MASAGHRILPAMEDAPLDYPAWILEALRSVVRRALRHAAEIGLPGDHHFYLTFRTDAPGVELSAGMRKRFPREMTIAIQHQFWDLRVEDETFSVLLRFDGRPERLRVPFDALTAFADPSVGLALPLQTPPPEPAAPVTQDDGRRGVGDTPAEAPASGGEAPRSAEASKVVDFRSFKKS
jgi:hypothetical protein